MNVKIYGAGSIGCHLAYSCRCAGMSVHVIDVDPKALERMQNDIYPTRYGSWDKEIVLSQQDIQNIPWDLVIIGTPPDSHCDLALKVLSQENTKAVLIEKPLCPPDLEKVFLLKNTVKKSTCDMEAIKNARSGIGPRGHRKTAGRRHAGASFRRILMVIQLFSPLLMMIRL